MSEFDLLVSSIILQFSHFTDWSINKPYLISQNFYNAFKSNEFVKAYLINIFKLNQIEINHLEFILNNELLTLRMNKEKQPKKKKKTDLEEINISITNINDILKLYVQCFNEKNNRVEKIENLLTKYKVKKNNEILLDLDNLIKLESAENRLNKLFIKFCKKNQLFKNSSSIFVKSIIDRTEIEQTAFCNCYIFFTKYAFPLIIKSNFNYSIDSHRSNYYKTEEISINSKRLFNHSYEGNHHGYFLTESHFNYDDETLNDLKTVLFGKDKLGEYKEKEFNLILYEWLQLGLLKHAFEIKIQAEEEEVALSIFGNQLNEEKEDE
ncbi:hypothetical protein ABK040_004929 [Willaertia magna]